MPSASPTSDNEPLYSDPILQRSSTARTDSSHGAAAAGVAPSAQRLSRRAHAMRARSCEALGVDGMGPELPPRRYSAVVQQDGSLALLPPLPPIPVETSGTASTGAPDSPPLAMHARLAQLRGFRTMSSSTGALSTTGLGGDKAVHRPDSGLASSVASAVGSASDAGGSICSLPRALSDAASLSGSRARLLASRQAATAAAQAAVKEPAPTRADDCDGPVYQSLQWDGKSVRPHDYAAIEDEQCSNSRTPSPVYAKADVRAQAYEDWFHCSHAPASRGGQEGVGAFLSARLGGVSVSPVDIPKGSDELTRLVGAATDDEL